MALNYYRALIRGENYLLRIEGKKKLYGFYTTRYIEADDFDQAEVAAVQSIRDDEGFKSNPPLNKPWFGKKPMIYVEELNEIESSGIEDQGGFSLYLMEGSE